MRYLIVSLAMLFAASAHAEGPHRIVLHLDEADPARQELVLNNASNINKYYQDKGEEAEIEIVSYGPGLTMLLPNSKAAPRVASIAQNFDNVSFRACANTLQKMEKKAGKPVALVPQAKMVPSGVIHLVERQEQGWSYIRP
ncbi:MAG: DsrE family protein [Gammaproteobacteria bacterium]|nr:DsrE family protein [Gammaproteobacteria bacterium]MCB1922414.1 DsrE family protein [Gammaproteobacteria bacterium]